MACTVSSNLNRSEHGGTLTSVAIVATAFAFVEYSNRGEAVLAVQHSSRIFDSFQIRVEHKVPKRLHMSHGGSPTSVNYTEKDQSPAQTQDMLMMLYHRGVEVGMNQAAHAQAMAPQVMPAQVYAPYPQPYYSSYETALGGYNGSHNLSPYGLGSQSYHNLGIATAMAPTQYVQASAASAYPQQEQNDGRVHPQSTRDNGLSYAWPLPAGDTGLLTSSATH